MQGKRRAPLAPANMLWLIQRDFLEGKTVQAMVKEALEPVPNPEHDTDIDQVCQLLRLHSLGKLRPDVAGMMQHRPHTAASQPEHQVICRL